MKLTESHEIPAGCRSCPSLRALIKKSNKVDETEGELFDIMSGRYGAAELREDLLRAGIDVPNDDDLLREYMEILPRALAPHADHLLDKASERQSEIEQVAQQYESGCPGVLRMRATDKLGYQVTATVCGSPHVRTVSATGAATIPTVTVDFKDMR